MKIISHVNEMVEMKVSEREYLLLAAGLREVLAAFGEAAISARMGATRAEVSELTDSLFEEGRRRGIEE